MLYIFSFVKFSLQSIIRSRKLQNRAGRHGMASRQAGSSSSGGGGAIELGVFFIYFFFSCFFPHVRHLFACLLCVFCTRAAGSTQDYMY